MRRSSPRALSSPRARSRRRWKTSGPREGSWVDCGFRIVDFGLGGEESAIRNRQSAITAAPAATKSRRCIVLAPPESAAYITRPPRRLEGGFPMQFEARIEPLTGKLPKVSYRWDPETDILSVACKGTGKTTGLNGTVPHRRAAPHRPASVVRGAVLLLVEVDKRSGLGGVWFLGVPPFANGEAPGGGGGGEVGGGWGRLGEANRGVMTLHAPEWS